MQFDIPGVDKHAYGLKTLSEAVYIRNHVLAQLDAADALPDTRRKAGGTAPSGGRWGRWAKSYTGTEFVAQMQNWVRGIASRWASVDPDEVRWVLVDVADAVLPELGKRLGKEALAVLAERGVDVRLGVSVASATATSVTLTDDEVIPSRTLVWGAGVAASPLIAQLGLPTAGGRLVVRADMTVPEVSDVWAIGDAAAVPDLAADPSKPTPPTAQHAQRQGVAVARNVAASMGVGQARPYKHTDLGLVADLGGFDGVAKRPRHSADRATGQVRRTRISPLRVADGLSASAGGDGLAVLRGATDPGRQPRPGAIRGCPDQEGSGNRSVRVRGACGSGVVECQ
ncbi:MAG: FAD-dependent oxidoreductase [Rhodococcus sp. (in: high G+C Gram-positive bacteria)]|nr:FAD-dependent oxidoreductase [Rhodococcus sp. (in: high G+C Gram-positive bacteria)]